MFEGDMSVIHTLAFSPNGTKLCLCSSDNSAKLMNTRTYEITNMLGDSATAHKDLITSVAFSQDGRYLATTSDDYTAKLWDGGDGHLVRTLEGSESNVRGCDWSPRCDRLVTGSLDGKLQIWNVSTGEIVSRLEGHDDMVHCCAWEPTSSGTRIVSGSSDKTLLVWDSSTGEAIRVLSKHDSAVCSCCWSPDAKHVLSASWDRTLILWDPNTAQALATLEGHEGKVEYCTFSRSGDFIASASADATLRVWRRILGERRDPVQVECVATLSGGHTAGVCCCAFTPTADELVSTSLDSQLIIWKRNNSVGSDWIQHRSLKDPTHQFTKVRFASQSTHVLKATDSDESPDGSPPPSCPVSMKGLTNVRAGVVSTASNYRVQSHHSIAAPAVSLVNPSGNLMTNLQRRRHSNGSNSPRCTNRIVAASSDGSCRVYDIAKQALVSTLKGHRAEITCCQYSYHGNRILTSSLDGTLRIWDASTGSTMHVLEHAAPVACCLFTQDGRVLSGGDDKCAKLWNVGLAPSAVKSSQHTDSINALGYSIDGKMLVSGSSDFDVKVWDAEGQVVALLGGHRSGVLSCTFLAGGTRLISSSDDSTVKVWSAETGSLLASFKSHTACVNDVSVYQGLVASASDDKTIKVWEVETGELIASLEEASHVKAVRWSTDGYYLATGTVDAVIKIWNAETFQEERVLEGHQFGICALEFAPNGMYLASASLDSTVKVWRYEAGTERCSLLGHVSHVYSVAWSPDSLKLVSAGEDSSLRVWDVEEATSLICLQLSSRVKACAWSPDGQHIAAGMTEGDVILYDTRRNSYRSVRIFNGHPQAAVEGLAFAPDSKTLVSAGWDWALRIWNLTSEKDEAAISMEGHTGAVQDTCFSPNGDLVVSASTDDTLKVWSIAEGTVKRRLVGHQGPVMACAYSPNGKFICSASKDETLLVWTADDYEPIQELTGHVGPVNSAAWSPDSKTIVSGGDDGELRVWDVIKGSLKKSVTGTNRKRIRSVAFSNDGTRVACGGDDGLLIIWPTDKWADSEMFEAGHEIIWDCAFVPDDSKLVAASADKTVRVIHIDTGAELCSFSCRHSVISVTAGINWPVFMAGDARGSLYFLQFVEKDILTRSEKTVPRIAFTTNAYSATRRNSQIAMTPRSDDDSTSVRTSRSRRQSQSGHMQQRKGAAG
mmetsp:Transcript_10499/g.17768  ORF Transcript_10499/g.17768 Transcript_10499/m.17768 type:complete len:1170 (-) Transcript_10499:144-3653(-)